MQSGTGKQRAAGEEPVPFLSRPCNTSGNTKSKTDKETEQSKIQNRLRNIENRNRNIVDQETEKTEKEQIWI